MQQSQFHGDPASTATPQKRNFLQRYILPNGFSLTDPRTYTLIAIPVAIGLIVTGANLLGHQPTAQTSPSPQATAKPPAVVAPVALKPGGSPLLVGQRDMSAHIIPALATASTAVEAAAERAATNATATATANQQAAKPNTLLVEQIHSYTVQPGDTLSSIADRNKLKLQTLLWANPNITADSLQTGSELRIPPEDGVIYKVEQGDTLSMLTAGFGADMNEVIKANGLRDPYILQVGQTLFVPHGVMPNTTAKTTEHSNLSAAKSGVATGTFVWPTQGWISTYFMELEDTGNRHAGLDIANTYGTPVYAADGGVVTLAGWNGNYGNCVIIDHGNGFVTWYGHFERLMVDTGDKVYQGQQIGLMGTTGYSNGPHLHFELHLHGKLVNPAAYLP